MSRTIRAYQLLQNFYAAKRCERPAGRQELLQRIDAREQAWQDRAEIFPILRR
jgi:hypothetical protein